MRLTTRGRFAVTAMLDLTIHQKEGPVSLTAISARQGISQSYLEQLFSRIRRRRLVTSVRGPGGGYRLRGLAEDTTVAQIISAVDDELDATQCAGMHNCRNNGEGPCITHELWSKVNDVLADYLESVSLADLYKQFTANQRGEQKILEKFIVREKSTSVPRDLQSPLQRELSRF